MIEAGKEGGILEVSHVKLNICRALAMGKEFGHTSRLSN